MNAPYRFDGLLEPGEGDCLCEACGEPVDAWPVDTLEAICADCEAERDAQHADEAADLADAMNAVAQQLRMEGGP